MSRSIRPIGPVTPALKKHGYRQMAAIYVDGKQIPNTLILSIKQGERVKFVGQHIDSQGEIHTTAKLTDMKKAAGRILLMIRNLPEEANADHIVTKQAPKRHSSQPTPQSIGAMIECKGCGHRHSDDDMCPED